MIEEKKSIVFSVLMDVGCYLHICVSASRTLEDFAEIILSAFGFINDHAHMFCMDNYAWSFDDCYWEEKENTVRLVIIVFRNWILKKGTNLRWFLILEMIGDFNVKYYDFLKRMLKMLMEQEYLKRLVEHQNNIILIGIKEIEKKTSKIKTYSSFFI